MGRREGEGKGERDGGGPGRRRDGRLGETAGRRLRCAGADSADSALPAVSAVPAGAGLYEKPR
jgi:hypothetical protein